MIKPFIHLSFEISKVEYGIDEDDDEDDDVIFVDIQKKSVDVSRYFFNPFHECVTDVRNPVGSVVK